MKFTHYIGFTPVPKSGGMKFYQNLLMYKGRAKGWQNGWFFGALYGKNNKMSEFSIIVFRNFNLTPPTSGQGVPASKDPELAQRVDGNTDSNNDGEINAGDRNGSIEAEELFEEVFSNREIYPLVIEQLHGVGLEDPFQITPEIRQHITALFDRSHPRTQIEKAIILFRSIIPSRKTFKVGETKYLGFTTQEGGLEVSADNDLTAPIRQRFGNLLPNEIMTASRDERIAKCLEYSHLLACFLRAAGIQANIVGEPSHAYVVALLDGERYWLDAAQLIFMRTENDAHSDRESICMHYSNEGSAFYAKGNLEEASRCYNRAINPIETREDGCSGCNGCATTPTSNTNRLLNLLFPEIRGLFRWLNIWAKS